MRRATVLRSVGAVFLPAAVFLSGCPQTCAPAPAPPAAPAAEAPGAPSPGQPEPGPAPGPPGTAFSARFDTVNDFNANFFWHWGMLPDPRGGSQHHQTAEGDHGHAPAAAGGTCGAAQTTTRTITLGEPSQQIYWCDPDGPSGPASGHVMTATPYTGYGILSFTPNRAFNNIRTVCWDQNLTDLGGRRWTNIVIVPESTFLANYPRFDYAAPGFGPGHDVGSQNLDAPGSSDTIKVFAGRMMWHPGSGDQETGMVGNLTYGNTDKATRYRHCITDNGNGTVTMTQSSPSGQHSGTFGGDLPDGPARVIFQDDRYDTSIEDHPITWHWDNIEIS